MRLDKYLKVSRIIKRRTVANEACDSGRVMLNDKVARASAEVKAGDVIEIAFGTKAVKVKVTSVQDAIRKEDAKEMFEYLYRLDHCKDCKVIGPDKLREKVIENLRAGLALYE